MVDVRQSPILGLDVGTKTIGVAISDQLRVASNPVTTIARRGLKTDIPAVVALARARGVEIIVIGLPYELDGTESRSARLARQIGDALVIEGFTAIYIDERFTSVEAERSLIAADVSRARRREVIDQVAAGLILQSYLDHGDWSAGGP